MAVQIDTIYQILSVNLLPSLHALTNLEMNCTRTCLIVKTSKTLIAYSIRRHIKNRESTCKFIYSNVCVERPQKCSHSKTANTHFMYKQISTFKNTIQRSILQSGKFTLKIYVSRHQTPQFYLSRQLNVRFCILRSRMVPYENEQIDGERNDR